MNANIQKLHASYSWKAASRSAGHISGTLWNLELQNLLHKSPPQVDISSKLSPFYIITPYSSKIHFHVFHLRIGLLFGLVPLDVAIKIHRFFLDSILEICPAHCILDLITLTASGEELSLWSFIFPQNIPPWSVCPRILPAFCSQIFSWE
jgi:hypothetical protein